MAATKARLVCAFTQPDQDLRYQCTESLDTVEYIHEQESSD